ncbi:MAG TPA: ABC transporter ATP-binding protein, partial [Chloroflexota bacterium]|nr:ABC transporter ATP-binding protein [Chloroflexota bacterium]
EERLAGLADIRGNALQRHTVGRMEALILQWLARVRAMLLVGIGIGVVTTTVRIATMALTLGGVAWLFRGGFISLGTAYLLVHYAQKAQSTVRQISRQLEDLQRATASLTRIRELEAERPQIVDVATPARLPNAPPAVTFDDVSFGYGGEPVVRAVSFSLAPGRTLGLLGRTGSGKSTLARLLFRLYDPTAGRVLLGDTDLRRVSLPELRQRVALVTQEVQLFHAPLRDNVALFDRTVADDGILGALAEVGLADWARSLPRGLDTPLASGAGGLLAGTGLSAGEAQLLAFARVFLRDPDVVVLDEPSSRLDPETEARIERAVDRLLNGRTAIVIAHRLRTLERADDVLVLEGGRVLEHGPRSALAADPFSHYARLLRSGGDLDARAAATAEGLVLA